MNLTSEQFAAVIGSLGCSSTASSTDKRRVSRIKHRACVEITVCAEGADPQRRISALIANLSPRGLGLVSHLRIGRGQQFVLHLPQSAQQWMDLLCLVVHCRPKAGGLYSIGAESNCPVTEHAMTSHADPQIERIRQSILK